MDIRAALREAYARLHSSETARLDAQMLLCRALGVERTHLFAYPEQVLTPEQVSDYDALVARRTTGEPVAYILGGAAFYDRVLKVTPAVLIPRPETELLVEEALAFAKDRGPLVAADIGTGSGAIAVTVAAHAPNLSMHAVDISPEALAIARTNAESGGVAIQFHQGDLATPLLEAGLKLDLLLANLPYIASDELPMLEVSQHEPAQALDGGPDGLRDIRRLLAQVPELCKPGALILLEIGADQGPACLDLAHQLNPRSASILKDLAGHDRILRIDLH